MNKFKKIICLACVAATFILTAASCSSSEVNEEDTTEQEILSTYEADTVVDETVVETTTETTETTTSETTTAQAETTTQAQTTTEATTAQTTTVATTVATTASQGSFSASDVGCTIKGVYIKPDTKWSNYSSVFGQALNEVQAPSCHFDGMDTIYEYSGFSIYTYMNNNEAYVYDIEITSSSISTPKGIKVGSSADDVVAAYGTGYADKSDYLIEYNQGSKYIYFTLDNGKVSMIEFYCD